jgi:PAS domain S-box-containing protein
MFGYKWLMLLTFVMVCVSVVVGGIAIGSLYFAALGEQRARLMNTAQSQSRLMESIARFNQQHLGEFPGGTEAATLQQIEDAHRQYTGFGETGGFAFARREGENIIFLHSHRAGLERPMPVPFDSHLAEPMRRALRGERGTIIGPDYLGTEVLAAYEPVAELDMGIVAKIDLAEVRAPFVRAGSVAAGAGLIVVILGAALFVGLANPMIQRLQRSEHESRTLAAIVQSSNDAIIGKNLDGTIQTWNEAAERMYGYSWDEVVGKPITILVPQDRRDEATTILERIRRGEQVEPFETVRVRKDGQPVHISLTASPIKDHAGAAVGASTIARDITDRKRAEEALHESEVRFRNVFKNAATGIAIADWQGNLQQCNKAYSTMLGYTEEELGQKNYASLVHPDDREANLVEIRRLQAAEIPHYEVENRYVHKDGKTVWVHKFISVLPDETGQSSHMMTLVTDFTERKRSEQDLRDREARLAAVLETAVDAIITIDERGTVESLNQAACQLFGFAADEVIGENVKMLMPQPYRDEHDQYVHNYLQSGQAKIIGIGREVVGLRKDGSTFPMHLAVSEVGLSDRRLFTGIVRDISDLKDAQEKLVQSERLAAMGQMLSAIAHESRNALQRIQAGVDMLAFEIDEQSEAGEDLARIVRAREDLQRLFDELRTYAAPIKLDTSTCSLSKVWQQAWSHLEVARAGRNVELHEETNGVDLTCPVDAFRVEQVFRNLMENSLAACNDPVQLHISCQESNLDGASAVCVSWRDNGPGLTDEQNERIFEAFFTTKSKGTGLGMAIAQRIIEAHQGTIRVGDCHHGGAEFLITLPRSIS